MIRSTERLVLHAAPSTPGNGLCKPEVTDALVPHTRGPGPVRALNLAKMASRWQRKVSRGTVLDDDRIQ